MLYNLKDAESILDDLLQNNKLSIFAGSGISVDSGLPQWDGFVDKYIDICEYLDDTVDDSLKFTEIIKDAKKNKNRNLIDTITALKESIRICERNGVNTGFCKDALSKIFMVADPNDNHRFIVSTAYKQIITTNYDLLLEGAADEWGYKSLLTSSYSYNDKQDLSKAIYSDKTAIIHAHGKITDIKLDQFVMTNEDYLSIMKHNASFRLIINTIFMTNSVLFAGYGGSDPHFEDIISDLNYTLNWNAEDSNLPKCYILLKKDKNTPIREFLNNIHRVDVISYDDHSQMTQLLNNLSMKHPRTK